MPSSSMEPTIPAGSRVTVDFSAYKSMSPRHFDIVAFRPPEPAGATFVFRVIALPGESVQIMSDGILIDGKKQKSPNGLKYIPVSSGINKTNLGSTEFFLLGDNTSNARDSRFLGPIERTNILGKVIKIEPMHAR